MVVLGTKSTGQVFGAPVEIDRNGEIRNENFCFIDVGDGCWRLNVLVNILIC